MPSRAREALFWPWAAKGAWPTGALALQSLVALAATLAAAAVGTTCEEQREAGLCFTRPLETARRCPVECEGHKVISAVRQRTVVDDVVSEEMCGSILNLSQAIRPGDGYAGNKHPHTPHELFGGITPTAAAHWAVSQPASEARAAAEANVRALLDAVRTVQARAESVLGTPRLHFDFVQLACREREHGEQEPTWLPDSMAHHADNCWRDKANDACRRENPYYHWRSHSAHLYLHANASGDFRGGELFYADSYNGRTALVAPACGRLVAFSAGPENLHGVTPVEEGRRCVLAVWLTDQAERAMAKGELEDARKVLDREISRPASHHYTSDVVGEYYEGCANASTTDADAPVLEETQQEVGGRRMTFQILHRAPQLTRIKDFLTPEEASQLIQQASPHMERSTVYEGDKLTTMNYRTSETAWIKDPELAVNVTHRVAEVTGLSIESAEDVQVAFYTGETQGKYEPHMDWGVIGEREPRRDFNHKEGPGARLATFLVFLNTVPKGGHTSFGSLGLYVRPEAGSALFWFNLLPGAEGFGDSMLQHGGCPVVQGQKYIATKWLHERGNEELQASFVGSHFVKDWGALASGACDSASGAGSCSNID